MAAMRTLALALLVSAAAGVKLRPVTDKEKDYEIVASTVRKFKEAHPAKPEVTVHEDGHWSYRWTNVARKVWEFVVRKVHKPQPPPHSKPHHHKRSPSASPDALPPPPLDDYDDSDGIEWCGGATMLGYVCPSGDAPCCSDRTGACGSGPDYCGINSGGCQQAYSQPGACYYSATQTPTPSSTAGTSLSNTPSNSGTPSNSPTPSTTPSFFPCWFGPCHCGAMYGGAVCPAALTANGDSVACCSANGVCGSGSEYCVWNNGCQQDYSVPGACRYD